MFADGYLKKNRSPVLIHEPPKSDLGISVVIPCFYEPDILRTLRSLLECKRPEAGVEVIIVINHSEAAPEEVKAYNAHTRREIESWLQKNNTTELPVFVAGPVELKKKWAGAGLARKRGMDEAVRRYNTLNDPDGLIVSLDADTIVEEEYLVEIEKHFHEHRGETGATIAFKHQSDGLAEKHLHGIVLYEKYMAYYKDALAFAGYPYPMFTVGSAFVVKAGAYVKRGGMNRRQAGEDFYFLQNLVQLGPVGEILTTTVHPSARLSDRVPFGTGPILMKWMKGEEDLSRTYNFQAFIDLKQFFSMRDSLFSLQEDDYRKMLKALPGPVAAFLERENFWEDVHLLKANCAGIASFRKRFFQRFNAFKILKYLHYSHSTYYEKAGLEAQIHQLKFCRKEEV